MWSKDQGKYAKEQGDVAKTEAVKAKSAAALAQNVTIEVEKMVNENKTNFLNAVDTVAKRDSQYPNPKHGDTVRVTSTATTYRFVTGTGWVKTDEYNPTAIDNITQQLADNTEQTSEGFFFNSITNHKSKKPLLVFIDDDARPHVLTRLKPVVEQEQVPISLAVVTSRVGNTEVSITLEQMKELEAMGFNFLSHTYSHQHTSELSDAEIEYELKTSHDWLRGNGFKTFNTGIVYPFGSVDSRVEDISRKYYKSGVNANTDKLNTTPLDTYKLDRIYYNLEDGTQQIAYVKQKIDEAIANGNLLIVGMHCFYQGFSTSGLIDVIQYAKTKGLEIVTLEDALKEYGNILDIKGNLDHIKIGSDGEGNIKDYLYSTKLANHITINSPIAAYPFGMSLTYFYTDHPNVVGFPTNSGMVETVNAGIRGYQKFYPYRSDLIYRRRWDNVLNKWTDFVADGYENSATSTLVSDWTGALTAKKSSQNEVHLTGILTVGNLAVKTDILTIPVSHRHSGFTIIEAFNHTTSSRVDFYLTNSGQLRLISNTGLATGHSIRFNSLYRI